MHHIAASSGRRGLVDNPAGERYLFENSAIQDGREN
jgi:hypothetical protein